MILRSVRHGFWSCESADGPPHRAILCLVSLQAGKSRAIVDVRKPFGSLMWPFGFARCAKRQVVLRRIERETRGTRSVSGDYL
jgi:hypothetical protein